MALWSKENLQKNHQEHVTIVIVATVPQGVSLGRCVGAWQLLMSALSFTCADEACSLILELIHSEVEIQ